MTLDSFPQNLNHTHHLNYINKSQMNFFKSILSDDPDPVNMNSDDDISNPTSSGEPHGGDDNGSGGGGLWSFGDLVKNLTAKSESDDDNDVIGAEEQLTNSDPTYSGENDVIDDVSNTGGGGLWSFGDLVKNLTANSESETYEGDEEQLTNSNTGENDVIDDVSNNGGGLWRFGDLVKNLTDKSESVLESYSPNHQNDQGDEEQLTNSDVRNDGDDVSGGGLWSFGDLVKNLTNKSETVLETYRRDLKEFGSGLKKESDLFREVANRAVKELPETMKKSIAQGKTVDAVVVDDSDVNRVYYSRFDSQLKEMQNDAETYCKDPEDSLDEYSKWKLGFVLSEKESEIEKVIGENGSVEGIYKKVVPNEVDEGSFWCRYFYKVYKLKQQEDVRASFVRRSLNVDDEEELSWDVDDDDDEQEEEEETDLPETETKRNMNDEVKNVKSNIADDDMEKNSDVAIVNENNVVDLKPSGGSVSDEKVELLKTVENHDRSENVVTDVSNGKVDSVLKTDEYHAQSENAGKDVRDEKVESVLKTDEYHAQSENAGKDVRDEIVESVLKTDENLESVKSSLQEEEDLEWDEIGDIGENDEKNVSQSEITPKKGEVFKRLNNAGEDDDEDLSWDIEDDDEPVKTGSSK